MTKSLRLIQHAIEEAWRVQVTEGNGVLRPCGGSDALQTMALLKTPLPGLLHFVWIGDPVALNIEYITIWQQVNKDKKVIVWYDFDCSLCQSFHTLLTQHAKKITAERWQKQLTELQNNAYDFIYPRLEHGEKFDALAIEFLQHLNIEISERSIPINFPENIESQSSHSVFLGEFKNLKKYYYYEIILRGNLAAASDIVRLLILYQYGGIYIDTDTLPAINHCFPETNTLLKHCRKDSDEYAIAAMTEAFLQKYRNCLETENSIQSYIDKIQGSSPALSKMLYSTISKEAKKITLSSIPSLGDVLCYPNFIMQSAVYYLKGVYFSNILGACSESKTISILLRSIKKRYSYIEKNDAIFTPVNEHHTHHYLGRLLTWRHESIAMTGEVTLALTGPGLIVETLLGLAYHLFKLGENIPPEFLSTFMHNDQYGIVFFDHTLHTPAGLTSTWMK